jgi:hypothetical protein
MINTRREFIRYAAMAGGALTALSGGGISAAPPEEAAVKDIMAPGATDAYDIVVAGGGTAGAIAAIQAGRLGMRTLLVEKNGMPGGTTTVAAVNFPGLFHAWGRQLIAGIGWELVQRAVDLSGTSLPDFSSIPDRHWQHQVRVNRALYSALLCEEFQSSGTNVLFHAMPATVEEDEDGFRLTLCTKTGLETIRARTLIDATGDATLTGMAGYPLVEYETRQPGTLTLTLTGYDFEALDKNALWKAFRQALDAGELHERDRTFVRNNIVHFLNAKGDNCTHITGIDGHTSAGRSTAEIETRVSLLRIYRFLRRQPGLEHVQIDFMAPECGIRESVTIRGEATITHDDYVTGRLWDDAVCYSFYPIDLHHTAGGGIDTRPLKPGTFPTVPRGALVPVGSRRLLAAGRCLSSDREANSALRVQATCMACGQAAAVIAAQAIHQNTPVMAVDMAAVKDTLRAHNAIVPDAHGPKPV